MIRFDMIRVAACLLLAICSFALTGQRAQACDGRVAGALLHPVRTMNKVRVNRLKARAARGNQLAAARVDNTHARMNARCR